MLSLPRTDMHKYKTKLNSRLNKKCLWCSIGIHKIYNFIAESTSLNEEVVDNVMIEPTSTM